MKARDKCSIFIANSIHKLTFLNAHTNISIEGWIFTVDVIHWQSFFYQPTFQHHSNELIIVSLHFHLPVYPSHLYHIYTSSLHTLWSENLKFKSNSQMNSNAVKQSQCSILRHRQVDCSPPMARFPIYIMNN